MSQGLEHKTSQPSYQQQYIAEWEALEKLLKQR